MANTHHTGIPKLQWVGAYPPCTPSASISVDLSPFCAGDSVMFTPVFDCVDTVVNMESKYGLLYNWYAATDARNICADGWEVPTKADWDTLITYLGGSTVAGGKLKETGFTYWDSPNTGATNEVGFNGRGSGTRLSSSGIFQSITQNGLFICSDMYVGIYPYQYNLSYTTDDITFYYRHKYVGNAIRLIRAATAEEQLLADGTPCDFYVGNDLKIYRTVKIGTQVWLADNLAETKYRNGDTIPEVTDNAAWAALTTGALCAYDNDWDNAYTYTEKLDVQSYAWVVNGVIKSTSPDPFVTTELLNNDKVYFFFIANENTYVSNVITVVEKTEGCPDLVKYGLLYNWYAATDARNICADGWEVPTGYTGSDFAALIAYIGGNSVGGGKLKETGLTYWGTPNTGATNEVGFNARGGSYRGPNGSFAVIKNELRLATKTVSAPGNYFGYELNYNSSIIAVAGTSYSSGYYIRPKKTTTSLTHGQTGRYTGNDGKVYRTICIGTQEWLADNLAETKYRNGNTIPEVTDNSAWAALETGALCAYDNDWSNV